MIDITPIANAIVALIAAVISAFVIPLIKAKIGKEKMDKVQMWVNIAVEAAEQIYAGNGRGAAKKAYVVEFLNSKGYKLDPDSLDKLIEAAVFNLPKYIEAVVIE